MKQTNRAARASNINNLLSWHMNITYIAMNGKAITLQNELEAYCIDHSKNKFFVLSIKIAVCIPCAGPDYVVHFIKFETL